MEQNVINSEPERIAMRPSLRSVLPGLIFAFVAAFCVHLWFENGWSGAAINTSVGGESETFILPVSLLVLLVFLARPIFLLVDSYYVIGAHHLYYDKGRCSLRRKHFEIPYEDIRGVRYQQTLLERILGVGTIIVWTATAESDSIAMNGLANPAWVTTQIRTRLDVVRTAVRGAA